MKEKEFINKVHKHLSKEVYRWKINDPYHGGVPDTYYSGPNSNCWIEYKYKHALPAKCTSKIKINLSEQQRIWLTRQKEHGVFTYTVFASQDLVYVMEDFTIKEITLKEFVQNKKRRDKAARISDDPQAQMDDVIARQGEMLDDDVSTDFASGGIARMLGE